MSFLAIKQEFKPLLHLAVPLAASGLVESSTGFINNMMIARLGVASLAASAVSTLLFMTLMIIFWGTFTAISTLVSHYHGAKQREDIQRVMFDGIRLALLLAIPVMLLLWFGAPILVFFGQPIETIHLAQAYLHSLAWAVIPDFLSMLLWQFFTGIGRPRVILMCALIYVPINVLGNYVLMFGKFGFPELGIAGIGFGTALAYSIILLVLIAVAAQKHYRQYFKFTFSWFDTGKMSEILFVGIPVGLMWALEIGFFLVIGFAVSHFGETVLAAHQIAIQSLFFIFSVANALAQGATVRVGHLIGQQDISKIPQTRIAAATLAFAYMFVIALIYWFFPLHVIGLDFDVNDPNNAALVMAAVSILQVSACFQILDGIRFSLFGILRGMKDTRFPLFLTAMILWVLITPLTYFLVFVLGGSVASVWWIMTIGMGINFILCEQRFRQQFTLLSRR